MTRRSLGVIFVLPLALGFILPPRAIAGFTVSGKKVSSVETNFAGQRQVSPKFKIPVQINHDVEQTRDLELTVVDDVFQLLLADHRTKPRLLTYFPTVVFVTEAKMLRFHEGPRWRILRRIARFFTGETGKQSDVYLSPTAVFISDRTLGDDQKLRSALYQALSYLLSREFPVGSSTTSPPATERSSPRP